jgi:hypothetical protein
MFLFICLWPKCSLGSFYSQLCEIFGSLAWGSGLFIHSKVKKITGQKGCTPDSSLATTTPSRYPLARSDKVTGVLWISDKMLFEKGAQLNGGQEDSVLGNAPLTNVYCRSDNILSSLLLSTEVCMKSWTLLLSVPRVRKLVGWLHTKIYRPSSKSDVDYLYLL